MDGGLESSSPALLHSYPVIFSVFFSACVPLCVRVQFIQVSA